MDKEFYKVELYANINLLKNIINKMKKRSLKYDDYNIKNIYHTEIGILKDRLKWFNKELIRILNDQ